MNSSTTESQQFNADIIIVGAGPAGSTAAYYLAKNGAKVILFDRETFPRDKVCGDFVSPISIKELQNMGITDSVEFQQTNHITKAAVFLDGEQIIVGEMPKISGLTYGGRVIPRKKLDHWIINAARNAGAQVIEKALVLDFSVQADAVTVNVKTPEGYQTFKAKLLIGADGTNSIIANKLRGQPPPKANRSISVRTYFENVAGPIDTADMHFTSQSFPGYCWLFPTGNGGANVGVGVLLEANPKSNDPKELFYQLINDIPALKNRLQNAKMTGKLEAWPLNSYDAAQALTADRIILIGEAAGLVNAVNGEGIQYALESGRWAAQTALECKKTNDYKKQALDSYVKQVETEFAPGFRVSGAIIQLIRNRNLNPLWLKAFQTMVDRSKIDPQYASTAGGILSGMLPTNAGLTPQFMLATLQEASISNTIRIIQQATNDPSSVPKNAIRITEQGLESAVNTLANPLAFIEWGLETTTKLAELALTTPIQTLTKIKKENEKTNH